MKSCPVAIWAFVEEQPLTKELRRLEHGAFQPMQRAFR